MVCGNQVGRAGASLGAPRMQGFSASTETMLREIAARPVPQETSPLEYQYNTRPNLCTAIRSSRTFGEYENGNVRRASGASVAKPKTRVSVLALRDCQVRERRADFRRRGGLVTGAYTSRVTQ